MAGQRYCPHCGHTNLRTAAFCGRCGSQLEPVDTSGSSEQPKSGKRWLILIIIVGLLIAALAGSAFFAGPFLDDLEPDAISEMFIPATDTPQPTDPPEETDTVEPGTITPRPTITPETADTTVPETETQPPADPPEATDTVEPDADAPQPNDPPAVTDTAEPAIITPRPTITPTATNTAVPPTETTLPTYTPPPTYTPQPTYTPPPADLGSTWATFGSTVHGESLEYVRFGSGSNKVMFLGGLHAGFTPASVAIAEGLVNYFSDNPSEVPDNITVYVIPSLNKDSRYDPGEWPGRINANGVDLNRNWDCEWIRDATWRRTTMPGSGGEAPFSEPEVSALRVLFLQENPDLVIIWGAMVRDGLIAPGQCSRATSTTRTSYALAGVYSSAAGYPVNDYEDVANQVINGDISNWLDKEDIPSFFVLLDDYVDTDWRNNLEGVRAILAYYAD